MICSFPDLSQTIFVVGREVNRNKVFLNPSITDKVNTVKVLVQVRQLKHIYFHFKTIKCEVFMSILFIFVYLEVILLLKLEKYWCLLVHQSGINKCQCKRFILNGWPKGSHALHCCLYIFIDISIIVSIIYLIKDLGFIFLSRYF